MGRGGLGKGFWLHSRARFVNGLKIPPVQGDVGGIFIL
jgi:hypothetical protein